MPKKKTNKPEVESQPVEKEEAGLWKHQIRLNAEERELSKKVFTAKHQYLTYSVGDLYRELLYEDAERLGIIKGSLFSSYSGVVNCIYKLGRQLDGFVNTVSHALRQQQEQEMANQYKPQEDEMTNEELKQAIQDSSGTNELMEGSVPTTIPGNVEEPASISFEAEDQPFETQKV